MHLLSSARAVIYSFRATGDFGPTFVSANIKDILGYEPREYLDSPDFWWRSVHPDDLPAVEAQSAQLFQRGYHTGEYRFRKADGSYCWVNDEQRLVRDRNGQPEEVVGSWSDISERKAAEAAVAAARAAHRAPARELAGGDLQLQGQGRFRTHLHQPRTSRTCSATTARSI